MTLAWQISIIDDLIKENPEATVGDFAKAMARMEPRQRRLPMIVARVIWPHLYTPPRRRWPRASIFDKKVLSLSEADLKYWRMRNEAFTKMLKRTSCQIKRA